MTTLVGMLIATVVLYIVFMMIREAGELTRTRFKFKYFALRDELAMLVATGKLKEDSWEYKHIIDTLNFHISAVEKLSMMRIVEMFAEYHLSHEERLRVRMMSRRVDHKEVAKIVVGYMETTYELIRRNSRAQIALVRLASLVLGRKPSTKARATGLAVAGVAKPNRALSAIRTHQREFMPMLNAA